MITVFSTRCSVGRGTKSLIHKVKNATLGRSRPKAVSLRRRAAVCKGWSLIRSLTATGHKIVSSSLRTQFSKRKTSLLPMLSVNLMLISQPYTNLCAYTVDACVDGIFYVVFWGGLKVSPASDIFDVHLPKIADLEAQLAFSYDYC